MKRLDKFDRIKLKQSAKLLPKVRGRRHRRKNPSLNIRSRSSILPKPYIRKLVKIEFPKEFGLFDHSTREQLLTALARLRWSASSENIKNVVIDLSKVEFLNSCGTLLFVAEVDRLMEIPSCVSKIHVVEPVNDTVCQMFQHIGFFDKFGIQGRFSKIENRDVIDWVYGVGEENNLNAVVDILPSYLLGATNKGLQMAVTGGMTEAVANSAEHAYIGNRDDGIDLPTPKRWWMFSRKVGEDVLVVICDLGIGIPRTLKVTWKEDLASFLQTVVGRRREDHHLIKFALTVGKTRTNLKHRGKGLKDILKVVRDQHVGGLRIYSNKGVYSVDGVSGAIGAASFQQSIFGTLVQWKIPIAAFSEVAGGSNG